MQEINIGLQQQNSSGIAVLQVLPSYIHDFIPTLMIWMFSILLPNLIIWSDRFLLGHWTRSSENHDIMRKTFW